MPSSKVLSPQSRLCVLQPCGWPLFFYSFTHMMWPSTLLFRYLSVLPLQKRFYFKTHRWVTAYQHSQKWQKSLLWQADRQGSCPAGGHFGNVQVIPVTCRGCGAVSGLSCWGRVTTWETHTQKHIHDNTCRALAGSSETKSRAGCVFFHFWLNLNEAQCFIQVYSTLPKLNRHSSQLILSVLPVLLKRRCHLKNLSHKCLGKHRTQVVCYAGTHLQGLWCVSAQRAWRCCCHCLVPRQRGQSGCWCDCTAAWSPHCQSLWWKSLR